MLGTFYTIIVLSAALVAWTLSRFEGLSGPSWALAPLALTLGFLPAALLSRRRMGPLLRATHVASGIALGFLTYFVIAAVACWAALGAAAALRLRFDPARTGAVLFGAAAAVGLFGLASAYWVRITRVTVRLRGLPPHWAGRSLALVTDVHLGNFRGPSFSRKVVAKLQRLGADCILIGGDLFDGVKIDVEGALRPWAGLTAPSGVFFVGGNHDDYGGRSLYFDALRRLGVRVLDNEKVDVEGLQLLGVHDRETHSEGQYRGILSKAGVDPGRPSILLVHRPDGLSLAEAAGVSLQLSGHTHKGQFWPWTLIVRRVYGNFAYGLNRFGKMLVYTSSGAGTWGPPFRIGSRSEIALIRLAPV
jgi:predicted MPP superfamily phosphohydrolase